MCGKANKGEKRRNSTLRAGLRIPRGRKLLRSSPWRSSLYMLDFPGGASLVPLCQVLQMERRTETKPLRCSLEKSKRADDLPPRVSLCSPARLSPSGTTARETPSSNRHPLTPHLPHAEILLSFWPGGLLKPPRDPLQARRVYWGRPEIHWALLVWGRTSSSAAFAPPRPATREKRWKRTLPGKGEDGEEDGALLCL